MFCFIPLLITNLVWSKRYIAFETYNLFVLNIFFITNFVWSKLMTHSITEIKFICFLNICALRISFSQNVIDMQFVFLALLCVPCTIMCTLHYYVYLALLCVRWITIGKESLSTREISFICWKNILFFYACAIWRTSVHHMRDLSLVCFTLFNTRIYFHTV